MSFFTKILPGDLTVSARESCFLGLNDYIPELKRKSKSHSCSISWEGYFVLGKQLQQAVQQPIQVVFIIEKTR